MVLRQFIPIPPPFATASYDYGDLAEGTGVKTFYLANSLISGSTTYHLAQNVIWSAQTEVSGSITTTGKLSDLDFDLTDFNLPQNIKGTAILNLADEMKNNTASQTTTFYHVARLRKYDGTTETEIASVTSNPRSQTGGSGVGEQAFMDLIPISIPNVVHFKQGDNLRLTIEVWVSAHSGGTGQYIYGIDPKDQTSSILNAVYAGRSSQSSISIPFKLKTD